MPLKDNTIMPEKILNGRIFFPVRFFYVNTRMIIEIDVEDSKLHL